MRIVLGVLMLAVAMASAASPAMAESSLRSLWRNLFSADPKPAPQVQMVRDGVAMLRDLEPGPWRVKIQGFDDEETEGELVQVRAGEETIARL